MTDADVHAMCKQARLKVLRVEWQGGVAVVYIEPLKVDPKTAILNLNKAGADTVTWAWNAGNEYLRIARRETA